MGSFLNVLILRLGTGRTIVNSRSQCLSCSHTLTWHDLIPVFSFVLNRGRCRYCGSKISLQYPIVELVTALIFAILAYENFAFIYYLISSILIAIFVYDLRHKIIPDKLVYLFIILALLLALLTDQNIWTGLVLFGVFGSIWLVSKGRAMGFGDAKLVLGIGFLLGRDLSISAMLIAFWSGAIVGICLLLLSKSRVTLKSEIPFAPFLIFGMFMALFLNLTLI